MTAPVRLTAPPFIRARRFSWLVAWLIIAGLGGLQAFGERFAVGGDDIMYLNISDLYLAGDLSSAANGYWSPAYPALLAVIRWMVRPAPASEAPTLHILNFALYLACFASFRFFVGQFAERRQRSDSTTDEMFALTFERPAEIAIAVAFFLWGALLLNGLGSAGADMLVATAAFAVSGILIRRDVRVPASLVAAGAVLGLGYLAKAAMFPISIAAALLSGVQIRPLTVNWRRIVLVLAAFFLASAPQVVSMSRLANRFSFGESGRLAYAGKVNGITRWWIGQPAGSGVPLHPIAKIYGSPDVYAFPLDRPSASYPFWDAPAYWLAGIRPHFDPGQQAHAIRLSLESYAGFMAASVVAFIGLLLMRSRAERPDVLFTTLPPLLVFAMYALVHTERRFFTGWSVILILSALAGLSFPSRSRRRVYLLLGLALAFSLAPLGREFVFRAKQLAGVFTGYVSGNESWQIAQQLHEAGVPAGVRVASVGRAFESYWARLARVQISVEINQYDAEEFWKLTPAGQQRVKDVFRAYGARAMVLNRIPRGVDTSRFVDLGGGYFAEILTLPQ